MNCTLCGNQKLQLLADSLRNSEGKVYYCPNCDLGILQAAERNVEEYYDKEYRNKFTDNIEKPSSDPATMFELRKNFQGDRIDIMKQFFSKNKNFLEIGCSAGQFLVHIQKEFSTCDGIELDTRCAKFVEANFGINVFTKELKNCAIPQNKYDNVAAFQVLEHVLQPVAFLNDIKKCLKADGRIFIEVPNLYDPLRDLWQIKGYQQFYYHEAHIHYFSRKSLEKLFTLSGLKIDKYHFIQDYNLFNHFYWYFNNAPQKECTFGLSEPHINFSAKQQGAGELINKLLVKTDKEYKNILSRQELTSNIFLVASKA